MGTFINTNAPGWGKAMGRQKHWSDMSQQASRVKQCILEQLNELTGPFARLLTRSLTHEIPNLYINIVGKAPVLKLPASTRRLRVPISSWPPMTR